MICINPEFACPTGLTIAYQKVASYTNHAKWLELDKQEREHLAECPTCNPELLMGQLWKNVKVIEAQE
jgi:hypothetical protein